MTVQQIRISRRLLGYFDGAATAQPIADAPELHALVERLASEKERKDGSKRLKLDEGERRLVLEYAGNFEKVALSNAGTSAEARADLNSARALIRWIEKGMET